MSETEKPEPMEPTLPIKFNLSIKAFNILSDHARLFQMDLTRYIKALLYKEAGLYAERLDHRVKRR